MTNCGQPFDPGAAVGKIVDGGQDSRDTYSNVFTKETESMATGSAGATLRCVGKLYKISTVQVKVAIWPS